MRRASWILLTVVSFLVLLGALASVGVAYFAEPSADLYVPGISLEELAADHPELEASLRGRRATAAAFAVGFAVMMLAVVLIPYRRGEVWAWWALLLSLLLLAIIVLLRLILLDSGRGVSSALATAVGVVALLLDVRRLKKG